MKELLLIFAQNPSAKEKNNWNYENGNEFFVEQLKHIYSATKNINVDKFLFHDSHIPLNDLWNNERYKKYMQLGSDAGEKMFNGFLKGFLKEYDNIVLINFRCMGLTTEIIEEAFVKLRRHDFVLGSQTNGNFYLLGMKKLNPFLFEEYQGRENYSVKRMLNYFRHESKTYYHLQPLAETRKEEVFALKY
ncbi:MAG: DUF2064 domain-containing protein [Cytophagaceae bacterium]|nr:DUF2064 domain-containing protein [Cytophagaceae bacterium]